MNNTLIIRRDKVKDLVLLCNREKMKFEVTYKDVFDGVENEEQAYDVLLDYLEDCVENGDVTAFNFKEVK